MKHFTLRRLFHLSVLTGTVLAFAVCGTSTTRTLTANTTKGSAVTTAYGGTCYTLTRDTSSCQSARTALGLSGNWLNFSCNVVLGLATAGGASTTSYSSAAYVTITSVDLPDYTSNYFPTSGTYSFTANSYTVTGNYSDMYSAYTTTYPNPGTNAAQSVVMSIPITPNTTQTTMGAGITGMAINGVGIYNNMADATDSIFAEAGSFDQCQGHPAGSQYHYHSEPYSISYNDNAVIGIMRDGYWIYGRKDYNGTTPGSISGLQTAGTSSTIYKFGGHTGVDPITGSGSTFHYHLTQWTGCYHQTAGVKSVDDAQSLNETVVLNNPVGTCGGSTVDTWFLTGRGNGGVFMSVPGGLTAQTPGTNTAGARYYYGSTGSCTGCN